MTMLSLQVRAACVVAALSLLGLALLPSGAHSASRPVSALLAPQGKCVGGDDARAPREAQRRAMLCLHNYARAQHGARPLKTSTGLAKTSAAKARDIVGCGEYAHDACGKSPLEYFRAAGVRCPASAGEPCSENLAWAWRSETTPREVMKAWLGSRSHREGLLARQMRRVGFSYSCGRVDGDENVCIWVAHFAIKAT